MQEVYRYGITDDCMGHWAALYRCLKRKTKFADQVTCCWQSLLQGCTPPRTSYLMTACALPTFSGDFHVRKAVQSMAALAVKVGATGLAAASEDARSEWRHR